MVLRPYVYTVVEREGEDPIIVGPFETFEFADEWAERMRELTEDLPGWDWYPRDGQLPRSPEEVEAEIRTKVEKDEEE